MADRPCSSIRAVLPRVRRRAGIGLGCALLLTTTGCEILALLDFSGAPPAALEQQVHPGGLAIGPMPPPPRPRRGAQIAALAPPPAAPREAAIARALRAPVIVEPLAPPPARPQAQAVPPSLESSGTQAQMAPAAAMPSPPPIDPSSLIGRSAADLVQSLGRPRSEAPIASGMTWRYERAECSASFLLLPELATGLLKVFSYEIAPRAADEAAACLGRIASDGRARGT